MGYSGFLLGPPVIGFLASVFGLRAGLVTLSFLALAADPSRDYQGGVHR